MLRQSFKRCLVDTQDDVAHFYAPALSCRLPGKQLFDPHHAGARRLSGDVLLPAEAETKPG